MIGKKGKKSDLSLAATLTLFLASSPFILIFFYLGKPWVSFSLAIIDVFFMGFYFLGKKGHLWASTIGPILLANFSTYFFNIVLGNIAHIYVLFFPFVILPLIVIESIRKLLVSSLHLFRYLAIF